MDRRKSSGGREHAHHTSASSSPPPLHPFTENPRTSSSKQSSSGSISSYGRVAAQVGRLDQQARRVTDRLRPAHHDMDPKTTAGHEKVKRPDNYASSPTLWPPGGYYLPPPGYQADSDFWRPSQPPDDGLGHFAGIPGLSFWGTSDPHPGNETWASERQDKRSMRILAPRLFPHLSHPNWSVPQAKAVLSTWSVLATLSAGGSATLLTQYLTDKISNLAISLNYAALILNIWGAALSAVSIVISITFQTPVRSVAPVGPNIGGGADLESAMRPAGAWSQSHTPQRPLGEPTLSRLASLQEHRVMTPMLIEILDRVAVAVGWIVPLAACCELAGVLVYAYTAHHGPLAPVVASAAVGVCLLVTGVALFAGWRGAKLRTREAILYEAIVAAEQHRSGDPPFSRGNARRASDTNDLAFSSNTDHNTRLRPCTNGHHNEHNYPRYPPDDRRLTDCQQQEIEFVERQHLLATTGGAA